MMQTTIKQESRFFGNGLIHVEKGNGFAVHDDYKVMIMALLNKPCRYSIDEARFLHIRRPKPRYRRERKS